MPISASSDVIIDTPLSSQIAANRRRALLLLGSVAGVFAVLGAVVGLLAGLVLAGLIAGLVAGLGVAWWVYSSAQGAALRQGGAVPASADQYPRYHNLTEGLCIAAGIPKPDLYVVTDAGLNACAVGRDPAHAAVVLTTGLLETLERIELEGLLAQQLSHIRNHDILPATVTVPLAGLLGPRLLPRAVGADREALADQAGVRLTRYPPGLIAALEKIARGPGATVAPTKATAHLWLVPVGGDGVAPLRGRIAALKAL